MIFKTLPWLLLISLLEVRSYRILVHYPLPSKSHSILGDGVVRHLLDDGHQVTYATSFPNSLKHQNLSIVDLSENVKMFENHLNKNFNMTKILNNESDMQFAGNLFSTISKVLSQWLANENFLAFLREDHQFDLVISEWMFSNVYAVFQPLYKCPFIWVQPTEPSAFSIELLDERPNTAYTPDIMLGQFPPFTFLERLQQLGMRVMGLVMKEIYLNPTDSELYETVFRPIATEKGITLPPFEEVKFNASLLFGNSHESLGTAMTLPQSYKAIGGYHIDTNVKPLPENLQKIMDNAKDGVIYVSMGSALKSKDLPDVVKRDLLQMFGKLKQVVIWKFEEKPQDAPENVHVLQWAPQPSILAHPNCVLFITHGGLLSTTETVHFGVPIIGLPVFGDQFLNVERSVRKGFAKHVAWSYDVASHLEEAIKDILEDPKYKTKVEELSYIYHDRVVSPGEELKHWVRHVIHTKGAPHLRSHALATTWYQRMYLDALLLALTIIYVCYVTVKKIFKSFTAKKVAPKMKRN